MPASRRSLIDSGRTRFRFKSRSAEKSEFRGSIDLVTMKAYVYDDETLGAKYKVEEIPADLLDQAKEYREKMLDAVAEFDDQAHGKVSQWSAVDGRRDPRGHSGRRDFDEDDSLFCADRLSRIRVSSSCWMALWISFRRHLIVESRDRD